MEKSNHSVNDFISQIIDSRKNDIIQLIELGKKITGKEPMLWGSIIGFGSVHYQYKTGHEGNMPLLGIANRKQAITLYVSYQIDKFSQLDHLGKYTKGVGCLYIKKLSDIKLDVLESLLKEAMFDTMKLSFITNNEG
jgi:hypothetical protein